MKAPAILVAALACGIDVTLEAVCHMRDLLKSGFNGGLHGQRRALAAAAQQDSLGGLTHLGLQLTNKARVAG